MQALSNQKRVTTAIVAMHICVTKNSYANKLAINTVRGCFDGDRHARFSKDG